MKPALRQAFLVHAVVALLLGLGLFLIPATLASWFNWTPFDPTMARFFGAAALGLAASSWLASHADTIGQVRIVLWLEMVYCILGAVAGLYQLLVGGAPVAAWVVVVILGGFGAVWVYFYRDARA